MQMSQCCPFILLHLKVIYKRLLKLSWIDQILFYAKDVNAFNWGYCKLIISILVATLFNAKKTHEMLKQEIILFPKQEGRAIRCLSGYISPLSAIRHRWIRGQEIHQNSLCSTWYTKEPLRISDSELCLWPSTLGPISSSTRPAWCELINHPSRLTGQTLTYSALYLRSVSLQPFISAITSQSHFWNATFLSTSVLFHLTELRCESQAL